MTGPFLKVLGTNKGKIFNPINSTHTEITLFWKNVFSQNAETFLLNIPVYLTLYWGFVPELHWFGDQRRNLATSHRLRGPSIHSALLWRSQSHSKPQPSHIHEAGFQTKDFNRHLKKTMETIYHSPAWCHMSTSHATDNIKQTVPSSQPVRQLCNDSMLQRNKIAKSRLKKK